MLYNLDCRLFMPTLSKDLVDMIFADPPYFLSNGGKSIKNGKIVSVNKGEWDKPENYDSIDHFTYEWLSECYRILKYGGVIWISGTHHNIFDIERTIKKVGFKIVNVIIWHKSDPPPLIYKNKFRFSYETIIMARKGANGFFNYDAMYSINTKEMEDVWTIPAVQMIEKEFGYHPTQKPEKLLERIITSTTNIGDTILDPFMGSGTTCAVAKKLKRNYIGIEKEKKYYDIAVKRLNSIN